MFIGVYLESLVSEKGIIEGLLDTANNRASANPYLS